MTDILDNLNDAQKDAVTHTEGPLLVLAGAGSGKTRVLTSRVAYLIKECGVAPWNILAITFTNKAAKEMADRVEKLLGETAQDIWVRTFHSTCVRILRRDADKIGYSRDFTIIDSDDQKSVIKECIRDLRLSDDKFPPGAVLGEISKAKEKLLTPDEFLASVGAEYRMQLIAKIYDAYETKLRVANCLDFDDLIVKTIKLFRECPDVLEFYRNKFRYILVDEYQDTNHAQYLLVGMLAAKHHNLCVVGDDDQSIYKFRGADIRNILDFEKQFPDAYVVRLEQNYRSTQNILDAANAVIKNNFGRKGKRLWTDSGSGEKITAVRAADDREEAYLIADEMARLSRDGYSYGEMAVLYRTNAQSRAIEDALIRSRVPYRVMSGTRFYDRMEIRDIVAYLRLVRNLDDNVSLMRIINVPSRKIGRVTVDDIANLANREGTSMLRAILDHRDIMKAQAVEFADMIVALHDSIDETDVDEVVNSVIEKSGYIEYLNKTADKAEDRIENVEQLVSGASSYMDETDEPTFAEYMDNIALVSDIDDYDEGIEAAVLMTLHAAKGLEFPVVFMCGMEEDLFPSSRVSLSEEDLEEERRLCYVGITRARKKLYLFGAASRFAYGETRRHNESRFIGEIPASVLDKKSTAPVVSDKPFDGSVSYYKEPKVFSYAKPKEKAAPSGDISFTVGDRVRHAKFGAGTIVGAEKVGEDVNYEIAFDGVGTKRLLGLYARLTRAE